MTEPTPEPTPPALPTPDVAATLARYAAAAGITPANAVQALCGPVSPATPGPHRSITPTAPSPVDANVGDGPEPIAPPAIGPRARARLSRAAATAPDGNPWGDLVRSVLATDGVIVLPTTPSPGPDAGWYWCASCERYNGDGRHPHADPPCDPLPPAGW